MFDSNSYKVFFIKYYMNYILILGIFVSFILTLLVLPKWIKIAKKIDMTWEDMNKVGHPKNVAASGGIVVVMSFIVGVLFYLFLKTFVVGKSGFEVEIFALLAVVLILALIGLTDDLLGWKHGGLSNRSRIALAIMSSIPLVVISAGTHTIALPFIGSVSFGVMYPLLLIPLAVCFVTTTYNFLAGFNGLEAGLGALILSFLSFVAFVNGSPWLAIIGLCMVASLIVFLVFNWVPAKVFPGDVLTYAVGALMVGMAILGNFEKILLIVYIPFFIEFILKIRGRLKKHSFGKVNSDGSLSLLYDKVYGLTHFGIWFLSKFKKKVSEKDVVYFIYSLELIFILIALLYMIF